MQNTIKSILALYVIVYLSSCVNAPDYPVVPVIKFESLSKNTIYQGLPFNPSDTIILTFSFTDGDGDLSDTTDVPNVPDIRFYDSRQPDIVADVGSLPFIPAEGTGNGIRGEVFIRIPNKLSGLPNMCCKNLVTLEQCQVFPNMPTDTFSYAITMRDRAGNVSNTIQSELITIICQE